MEYYNCFTVGNDWITKTKVEIGTVLFTNWNQKSNYPKNAIIKRYLLPKNRGEGEAAMMLWVNSLHPNTVKYYSSGYDEEHRFYILMENCTKGDLKDEMMQKQNQDEHFSVFCLINYFFCLADIFAVLHTNSIWHRDIKPQNIFINEEGKLKLGDYGYSKYSSFEDLSTTYHSILGTQPYMSPELKKRRYKKDAISSPDSDDIWALGQTFYEMCTFERISIDSDINSEIYNGITSCQYPECFITLLSGMLNPNLSERWNISHVWGWLYKLCEIKNIRYIYNKPDENEEKKEETYTKSTEKSITESETVAISSIQTSTEVNKIINIPNSEPSIHEEIESKITHSQNSESQAAALTRDQSEFMSSNSRNKDFNTSNEIPITNKKIYEIPDRIEGPIIKNPENKPYIIDKKEAVLIALSVENQEKSTCKTCKKVNWSKFHPSNWKPYNIRCKNCKSNYCSFCGYGGGHKKCEEFEGLIFAIKESIYI